MKQIYYVQVNTYQIAIADLIFQPLEGRWEITRINVPSKFRGQGFGSQLLRMICEDADHEGEILSLHISPSDGLSYEELEAWYLRYGFRKRRMLDGSMIAEYLVREPKHEE